MSHRASARTPATSRPEGAPAATTPAAPAPAVAGWERLKLLEILGQRRQFLVDPRTQLRAAALTAIVALVLLVLLNLSLHASRSRSAAAVLSDAPELEQLILSQNRYELGLVALASLLFLLGVVTVVVLETHKTAGAAFNVARHLRRAADGQYRVRLRLRRGDNLVTVEAAFNDMMQRLEERQGEEAAALERFADECEKLTGPDEAARLAAAMRDQARRGRERLA
jgi:hypothetical protein